MKIREWNYVMSVVQLSQYYLFLAVLIQRGFGESTLQADPAIVPVTVTPSITRTAGQSAFITEWRWISDERYNTVESWSPGPRLDHAFLSHKGDQWLYGGHINAKNYYDLWLASGNEPWTRIPLASGLVQNGPPKKAALCVFGGTLALYPLDGDTVWLLDFSNDNAWTAFVCFGSSIRAANGTTNNYCPGNPGQNAISWCDGQEGRLFVYSGNVIWSFSLSAPHWLSHVISQSDASRLSRCASTMQAGLTESDKAGLYLLCAEDEIGFRNLLRLKVKENVVHLDDLGSLILPPGNVSSLGMTVAICDEIVALVIAHEDNLPVWVIDNQTGCLVKTGNSWVGYAIKWLHIYSAVDYTVTCAGNTYRLRNPRIQPEVTELGRKKKYWPSRRGSFQMNVIELGELIKVDQDGLHLYHHRTAAEALVFFALSLLMFLTFGVAWFFKRCVTMPTVPRGWPGSWGRSTGTGGGAGDCTPTARYTPIPRGEIGLIT